MRWVSSNEELGIILDIGTHIGFITVLCGMMSHTVYSFDEINDMAKKKTKVILFRIAKHFTNPIGYDWLINEKVVNGYIQTIRKISNDSFEKIIN